MSPARSAFARVPALVRRHRGAHHPQRTKTTFSRHGRLDYTEDGGKVTLTFTSVARSEA
jgi:hypothetical protein